MPTKQPTTVDAGKALAKAEKQLQVLNHDAQGLAKWLQVTKIATVAQMEECASARAKASQLFETAEEDRKSITGPINQSLKIINARYKPVTEHASRIKDRCSALLLDYRTAELEIAVAKAAREAAKAAKQGSHELAQDILNQAAETKVDLGGATTRKHYSAKIVNPKAIPVNVWMTVSEELTKKLSALARAEKERFAVPGAELVISDVLQGGSSE